MPDNNGTYTRAFDWTDDRDAGINISAARSDTEMDGIATALTNRLTRDGTGGALANIPMNGYVLTGLGNGTATNHSVNLGQLANLTGVANSTITTALIADGAVTAAKIGADAVNATHISASAVNTSEIADGAVTTGKLANGTANSLIGYNGTGVGAEVAVGSGLQLTGNTLTATGTANVTGTAGETLTINATNNVAVVYQDVFNARGGGADRWYLVDADATGPVKVSPVIGLITANIANTSTGSVYIAPTLVTGLASLTAGSPVWAHAGTAGAITQTKPATPSNNTQVAVIPIGNAYNATALQFKPPGPGSFAILRYDQGLANNSTGVVEHWTDADVPTRRPVAQRKGGSASNTTGTFANTTDGGTGINSGIGYNWGMKLTIPASATQVDYFTVKMVSVSTGGDVVGKVYSNNAGSPGTQVGSDSDTQNVTSGVNYTFTFGTPVPVTGGSDYWMIFAPSAANFSATIDTTSPVAGYVSGRNNTITSITDLAGSDTRMEIGYSEASRSEPFAIFANLTANQSIGASFSNATGGENDTKTTFRNLTGAAVNLTAGVIL